MLITFLYCLQKIPCLAGIFACCNTTYLFWKENISSLNSSSLFIEAVFSALEQTALFKMQNEAGGIVPSHATNTPLCG